MLNKLTIGASVESIHTQRHQYGYNSGGRGTNGNAHTYPWRKELGTRVSLVTPSRKMNAQDLSWCTMSLGRKLHLSCSLCLI